MRLKGPFRKIFGMSKRDAGQGVGDDGLTYDVTFVHQNHVNLCGDASAQMLLLFHNRPASVALKQNQGHANVSYRLQRNPRGVVAGSNHDVLIAAIRSAGLRAWDICPTIGGWTAALVMDSLQTYGPYAQSVKFSAAFHWVVVIGTDGRDVIYHDPWRGSNVSKTMADWIIAAQEEPGDTIAATEDYVEAPNGIQVTRRP